MESEHSFMSKIAKNHLMFRFARFVVIVHKYLLHIMCILLVVLL